MKQKRILTIQDLSCFGKCSGSMAIAILSALGHETVILPTALLSTHTGGNFTNYSFMDLEQENRKIAAHWDSMHIKFDAVYIGYLGTIAQIEQAKDWIRRYGDDTVVLVDPAMADDGVLYDRFNQDYVDKMRELCQMADFLTPNETEHALLGNRFKGRIIETGVKIGDEIGVRFNGKTMMTPHIQGHFYGTGDAFSAAFIGAYMKFGDVEKSLEIALNFVWRSIEKTLDEKEKFWYGIKFEQNLAYLANL